ncbi:helix-turn-helix domain-containing protein [Phenylobacterium sp. LjRoot219]|uniref:MarR family winged helix-turn-helix transcriptional regulator n=1 Tax=Phenylobacterium sp. LjRoot219 TaxID=3342283 RepID=UPI003ECD9841
MSRALGGSALPQAIVRPLNAETDPDVGAGAPGSSASLISNPMIQMIDEVIRLGARLRGVFATVTAAAGLSPMELTVLTAVAEARTPPTVPQIGRSLGHPRQVIQRAANALTDGGLIEPAANPHHKRAQVLRATAAGRKLKGEADARALAAADAAFPDVDASQCERLATELHALRTQIEAHLRARSS